MSSLPSVKPSRAESPEAGTRSNASRWLQHSFLKSRVLLVHSGMFSEHLVTSPPPSLVHGVPTCIKPTGVCFSAHWKMEICCFCPAGLPCPDRSMQVGLYIPGLPSGAWKWCRAYSVGHVILFTAAIRFHGSFSQALLQLQGRPTSQASL